MRAGPKQAGSMRAAPTSGRPGREEGACGLLPAFSTLASRARNPKRKRKLHMTRLAWLNGVYVAAEEAKISPFDRGFLFADGVYEVTCVYGGQPIDMQRHLDRLERSLKELGYSVLPDRKELEQAHRKLIAENGITEGFVYTQVTRGAYGGRDFPAPDKDKTRLTVFCFGEPKAL